MTALSRRVSSTVRLSQCLHINPAGREINGHDVSRIMIISILSEFLLRVP